MKNNKVVFDLNKAQFAWQSWVTMDGNYKRKFEPEGVTVFGQGIDEDAIAYPYFSEYPNETLVQRAHRYMIVDRWIPCVTFCFAANNQLTFTGDKAERLWDAWTALQFNRNKRKKKQ